MLGGYTKSTTLTSSTQLTTPILIWINANEQYNWVKEYTHPTILPNTVLDMSYDSPN